MFATGKNDTEPMSSTVHSRVPAGTYPNPILGQTAPSDLMLRREAHKNITGDQRTPAIVNSS